MYAFGKSTDSADDTENTDRDPKREGMLGNTSSVDVFTLSAREQAPVVGSDSHPNSTLDSSARESYPLFYSQALPLAQSTTLGPGDALVIPPGWWHAMRGLGGGSFSVSFWF
jgi:hypothetical protein